MNVVVCDDTEALRRELRIGLEAAGFAVVGEAGDGIEAQRVALEARPDALVVDLSMPGRDGLELLPILRREHPEARIVVFSGFEASRMADAAMRLGADAYVEKGRPFAELVSVLSGAPTGGGAPLPARTSDVVQAPVRPHGTLDAISEVYERDLTRVADDLHDGPVQVLTAAAMLLRGSASDPERLRRVAEDVAGYLDEAIGDIRSLMSQLPSWDVRGASLPCAISELVRRQCEPAGIHATVRVADAFDAPTGHCAAAYRTVQEALCNVARHSSAEHLLVEVADDQGAISVQVKDDGVGFDPSQPPAPGHYGLTLMRRRVESLGGRVEVCSEPGAGTDVRAFLPRVA